VEGWLESPAKLNAQYRPPPAVIEQALRALTNIELPAATTWEPDNVEVYFWAEGPITEPAIEWPVSFPSPAKGAAQTRGIYSVLRITWDQFTQVRSGFNSPVLSHELYGNRIASVHIGKRQWRATVRYPLPGERVWHSEAA
jgi:hypothetical protein